MLNLLKAFCTKSNAKLAALVESYDTSQFVKRHALSKITDPAKVCSLIDDSQFYSAELVRKAVESIKDKKTLEYVAQSSNTSAAVFSLSRIDDDDVLYRLAGRGNTKMRAAAKIRDLEKIYALFKDEWNNDAVRIISADRLVADLSSESKDDKASLFDWFESTKSVGVREHLKGLLVNKFDLSSAENALLMRSPLGEHWFHSRQRWVLLFGPEQIGDFLENALELREAAIQIERDRYHSFVEDVQSFLSANAPDASFTRSSNVMGILVCSCREEYKPRDQNTAVQTGTIPPCRHCQNGFPIYIYSNLAVDRSDARCVLAYTRAKAQSFSSSGDLEAARRKHNATVMYCPMCRNGFPWGEGHFVQHHGGEVWCSSCFGSEDETVDRLAEKRDYFGPGLLETARQWKQLNSTAYEEVVEKLAQDGVLAEDG